MYSRKLALFGVAVVGTILSACSTATEASSEADDVPPLYTQTLGSGSVTFVLARAEQQVSDEITLFDHQCTSGRITLTVRDTLVLSSNGQLTRNFNLRQSMAGTVSDSPNQIAGTWRLNPNWRRSRRAGVSLLYTTTSQPQFGEAEIWLVDANTLLMEGSMGGSCPGSPKDGRNADMYYSRR